MYLSLHMYDNGGNSNSVYSTRQTKGGQDVINIPHVLRFYPALVLFRADVPRSGNCKQVKGTYQ